VPHFAPPLSNFASRAVCIAFVAVSCNAAMFLRKLFMNENVYWVIELAVNPGRFEDLKTLISELLEANRKEVGFLTCEFAISDDRQVCHIYERFQDSAAIMNHLQLFGANFATRFFEILKPTRFVIYGKPSVEVKNALAASNPVYMASLGGFRKHPANDS
jgi:quinol monooxygenase YgiN